MNIAQLLHKLTLIAHIEIVIPLLPEMFRLADQSPGHALLQRFDGIGEGALRRFAEQQMNVIGHDDIAIDAEPEAAPHTLHSGFEYFSRSGSRERSPAVIATERHEVSLFGRVKSLQSPRHSRRLRSTKAPLKPKNGLNGPPATRSGANLTGGTNAYDSGTVSVTVNGRAETVNYGQSDTPTTIATNLLSTINGDSNAYATATRSGTTLLLTSKTGGSGGDYSLSAPVTYNSSKFSHASFSTSPSGADLTGGTSGVGTIYNLSLGYAPNGNVTSANDTVNGNWTYKYDDFNRLVSGTLGSAVLSWTYDQNGNRWTQTASGSGSGTWPQPQYSFTGNNNHIDASSGVLYDTAGNMTKDPVGTIYYYDAENRIIQVGGTKGTCSTATACYTHDAEGRRAQKTLGASTVDYLYDLAGKQVAEVSSSGTWNRGEVYGGNRHLATYTGGASGATYFNTGDWLGTERMRTSLTAITETCTSMPFGDDLTCTGTDTSPMHFTGKERDAESGNDYFGARHYASSMGRWLSPDPGWFIFANILDPQSLNLYSHALNNPLVWIDSDGLELVRAVLANGQTVVVDRSVAPELISMVREATNAGLIVTVSSSFRSYSKQAELYSRWKNGQSKYPAAPPGRSAHNGGLAVDFRPNLNSNQMNALAQLGHQNGLNYAGQKDGVHFGPYYAWEINWDIVHENMNSQPDSTIVDGGVTTVVVTDTATTVDVDNSTVIPDQITPVDIQNLDLTPQPPPPPPPPPQQDQQSQQ